MLVLCLARLPTHRIAAWSKCWCADQDAWHGCQRHPALLPAVIDELLAEDTDDAGRPPAYGRGLCLSELWVATEILIIDYWKLFL